MLGSLSELCVALFRRTQRFTTYMVFAGVAALLELTLLYFFTSIIGLHYMLSVLIAYPSAVMTNYLLNKFLNFKCHDSRYVKQFTIFVFINLGGLGITMVLMYVLVEYVSLWYLLARILSYAVTLIYSFNLHKHITFHEGS